MPIYEYRCQRCGAYNSVFLRSFSAALEPKCSSCGSDQLRRLISRFAVVRSEESRLDDLADPSNFGDLDENDPKSVAKWARRMGQEMGEDLGPEFHEMVDRMEAGEMPEELAGEGAPGEPGSSDEGGDDLGGDL